MKTVQSWVRIYQRDGGLDIQKKGRPTKSETRSYKERYEILKKVLAFLDQESAKKKVPSLKVININIPSL